ncbi:hypothetical protein RCL1_006752 [Eukaryota sp. TZLM3-RCL]
MLWSDWQAFVRYFQCLDVSLDSFNSLLSKLYLPIQHSLLPQFLSFSLVCFPDVKTRLAIQQHMDSIGKTVWYFDHEQSLLPYVTASIAIQNKTKGSLNLVHRVVLQRRNYYALVGLLHQAVAKCEPRTAVEVFLLRTECYSIRLFSGVWRLLFQKMASQKCLHSIIGRIARTPQFLQEIYSEYFDDYELPKNINCIETPFVCVSLNGSVLEVNERTCCIRSLFCQEIALKCFHSKTSVTSVVYNVYGKEKRLQVDVYQDLLRDQ